MTSAVHTLDPTIISTLDGTMDIPQPPYVGLYGSHSGDWRIAVIPALQAARIAYYDPTDPGWQEINGANGDSRQQEIDGLVAKQHLGLNGAACVVFHLAWRKLVQGSVLPDDTTLALAARCELGFLTGRGIPTFVHIEPDVEGRNYLWAQIRLYAHMVRCDSLDSAVRRAIAFVREFYLQTLVAPE